MLGNGKAAMTVDAAFKTQCNELGGQNCGESRESWAECGNPLCHNRVEPKRKHAPVKFYSPDCAQKTSILKRASKLFLGLSVEEAMRVLGIMSKGLS